MTPLTILVIEADETVRALIADFISLNPTLKLLGVVKSEPELNHLLNNTSCQIIIYNPGFPGLGGLKFLEKLASKSLQYALVVTIINRGESAVESLAAGAMDCLEIPVSREQFDGMIARIRQRLLESSAYRATAGVLYLRTSAGIKQLKMHDIVYLSGAGKKTTIHTQSEDIEITALLKTTVASIQAWNFCRIHKRYVVNLFYFGGLRYDAGGRYILELKARSPLRLPVGAIFARELRQKLGLRKNNMVEKE